jgi:hypothetical protein
MGKMHSLSKKKDYVTRCGRNKARVLITEDNELVTCLGCLLNIRDEEKWKKIIEEYVIKKESKQ